MICGNILRGKSEFLQQINCSIFERYKSPHTRIKTTEAKLIKIILFERAPREFWFYKTFKKIIGLGKEQY